jgi:hypothetical protein
MRHHGFLVTDWSEQDIQEVHKYALGLFGERMVTSLVGPAVNGYMTFAIGPDGSKEGWDESDDGNQRREEFKEFLHAHYKDEEGFFKVKWVEIQYADDNYQTCIVEDSDTQNRERLKKHPRSSKLRFAKKKKKPKKKSR